MSGKLSKREANARDKRIEAIYYAKCSGVVINVFDISKIFAAGRLAIETGGDVERAVVDTALRCAADIAVPKETR